MKATELRVGNYIQDCFDVKKREVRQLDLEDFSAMLNYRNSNHPNTYIAVKINNEWIKSFGFENSKNQDKFFTKDNTIGISTADDKFRFIQGNFVCQIVLREFEYVHELQNLYYAITGVELSRP
jgi:hypothetical protein